MEGGGQHTSPLLPCWAVVAGLCPSGDQISSRQATPDKSTLPVPGNTSLGGVLSIEQSTLGMRRSDL